jgi:hypothetical protein
VVIYSILQKEKESNKNKKDLKKRKTGPFIYFFSFILVHIQVVMDEEETLMRSWPAALH